ncbi:MAG: hypothetical protein Q8N39_10645 [Pelolinea sp.]|nr:hypothetical protein [Pelolinea sp.]
MSAIFFLVGLVFLISGFLSIAKISDIGLNFVSKTQIHLLPFLNTFPIVWVYLILGLILIVIAGGISRRS